MKSFLWVLFTLLSIVAVGQNKPSNVPPKTPKKSVVAIDEPSYEMYPTKNMWNFLKLNTITVQVWVVQYGLTDENRIQIPVNSSGLLWNDEQRIKGRFKLIPTENMWNFILIDQVDGRVWQVQWSTSPSNMGVMKISD